MFQVNDGVCSSGKDGLAKSLPKSVTIRSPIVRENADVEELRRQHRDVSRGASWSLFASMFNGGKMASCRAPATGGSLRSTFFGGRDRGPVGGKWVGCGDGP